MARTPLRSALLLVAAAVFTLQSAFVSSPVATQRASTNSQDLLSAATAAGAAALGAAPAFAEELPPDEIYNRKVLEA
eukprot:CAMPEP_0178459178 /NCGR_PEP_ID=MMETSP0689_2-20121128/47971_1 /TAXON_ID=160604 /ORGANISM="Amphidinium massartii, Strain CS-259" /LENGTH=76 /DNA_ID=CAMNT_0020085597 /DNA_START=81 /DNA_END=307 /DNA_ORIENTATION=-